LQYVSDEDSDEEFEGKKGNQNFCTDVERIYLKIQKYNLNFIIFYNYFKIKISMGGIYTIKFNLM
jgi:hypothetical protein